MANYDLYTELHLDKDMPPSGISEILAGRIADLRTQGYRPESPEMDQLETAQAILGDPYKRDIYEAALYSGPDDVVNIRWLHDLADAKTPVSTVSEQVSAEPVEPEGRGDSGAADSVGRHGAGYGADYGAGYGVGPDTGNEATPVASETPSAAPTRQQAYPGYEPLTSEGPSAPDTGADAAADEPSSSTTSIISPVPDDADGSADSADSAGSYDPAYSAAPIPDNGTPEAEGGAVAADSDNAADATDATDSDAEAGEAEQSDAAEAVVPAGGSGSTSSAWLAAAPAAAPNYSAPHQESAGGFGQSSQKSGGAGLDTSKWALNGRRRSESKVYVAILAVLALSMLYPLIATMAASDTSMALFRATLFTLAFTVAVVSVNEVIWGVRKIVAPDAPSSVDAAGAPATPAADEEVRDSTV